MIRLRINHTGSSPHIIPLTCKACGGKGHNRSSCPSLPGRVATEKRKGKRR